MILVVMAIAWMSGIVLTDQLGLSSQPLLLLGGIGGILAAGGRKRRGLLTLGLGLLAAAAGGWRLLADHAPPAPNDIRHARDQGEVQFIAVIAGDPKRTETGQQLILEVEQIALQNQLHPAVGSVLANVAPYPAYRYGQRVAVSGTLETPRSAERAGEFDYRAYLARKNIFALSKTPEIRVIGEGAGLPLLGAIAAAREYCQRILWRMLPEPQSSLAIGILLGLQSSIPEEVYTAFSVTGTSHILVVSGWNFTIVAAVLAGVAQRLNLGRQSAFWGSLVTMWLYAFFVGASAAVLRAATMASLMVLARTNERRSEPWTLLAVACWAMSAHDPDALWDLGFQLSASATASLFAFGKGTEALLDRIWGLQHPWLAAIREALTATLAAQILTLPIILYNFGNLSIIAPLANVLIVPIVPYAMFIGTAALVGGLLWLPLGEGLGWILWLPLTWMAEGAVLLAALPWAAVQVPPFPLRIAVAYYVAVIAWWLAGVITRPPESAAAADVAAQQHGVATAQPA